MTQKPYITLIESTLKSSSGRPWQYKLQPFTLITGHNGSGKSRITQAAELALEGLVSDVAGRDTVKSNSFLQRMSSDLDEGQLSAVAVLSDGTTATWSRTDQGMQADGQVPGALALRPILDAFTGSDAKAYLALVEWACQDVTRDQAAAALNAAGIEASSILRPDLADEAVIRVMLQAMEQDQKQLKAARALLKSASARVENAQKTLSSMKGGAPEKHRQSLKERLLEVARDPDAILLREIPEKWVASMMDHVDTLATAQTNQQAHSAIQLMLTQARAEQKRAKEEVAQHGAVSKVLNKALASLLELAAPSFCARVAQYLPPTREFALQISPFRFGLAGRASTGEEQVLSALSGAEWVMVTSAIAAAVAEDRPGPSVLVLQDRAWDPETLRQTMEALLDFPGQVLITSTTEPMLPVEGWHIIDLNDEPGSPA